MPTYPNYLSPASGYGTSFSSSMSAPALQGNFGTGAAYQVPTASGSNMGGVIGPNGDSGFDYLQLAHQIGGGSINPSQDASNAAMMQFYMAKEMGPLNAQLSSQAEQNAYNRQHEMQMAQMQAQLAQQQMLAQQQWNAMMQGFGSDLSLRNNLYGIAAQQPSSQQVGNALQIIGGDSARAFQPPVNPIGPAKGAVDYWPGGTPPAQSPPYIRRG